MAKYRLLTQEELAPLQEEFLKFLIVQNILPEQWEALKANQPSIAEKHIATFSDMVFEKIMLQHQFLEKKTSNRIEAYHFMKDEAQFIALQGKPSFTGDFINNPPENLNLEHFELIKGKKKYAKSREEEMFQMTQKGCLPSDGYWYKRLMLLSV